MQPSIAMKFARCGQNSPLYRHCKLLHTRDIEFFIGITFWRALYSVTVGREDDCRRSYSALQQRRAVTMAHNDEQTLDIRRFVPLTPLDAVASTVTLRQFCVSPPDRLSACLSISRLEV